MSQEEIGEHSETETKKRPLMKILLWGLGLMALSCGIGVAALWPRIKPLTEMSEMIEEDPQWVEKAGTAQGIIELIKTHPENVSVHAITVDEAGAKTEGLEIEHNIDVLRQTGSTIKIVVLAAYAEMVATGALNPDASFPVSEWEAHYIPGIDGGAHIQAMRKNEIDIDEYGYTKNDALTATWSQVAEAMIIFSDNAATDLLIRKIGQETLNEMMKRAGCQNSSVDINLAGLVLSLDNHESPLNPEKWAKYEKMSTKEFNKSANTINKRFLEDKEWRKKELESRMGFYGRNMSLKLQRKAFLQFGPQASAADMSRIMALTMGGSFPSEAANPIMRKLLEWPMERKEISDEFEVMGMKGGSFLGILGFSLYAKTKKTKKPVVATIFFNDMPISAWVASQSKPGLMDFIRGIASEKPEIIDEISGIPSK